MTQATPPRWSLTGEYFENCNCDVVCPCEISAKGFMQAMPDRGFCDVFLIFHTNEGRFGDVDLSGTTVMLAAHAPGVMAEGNWTVAAYIDSKANPQQQEALGAIFSGGAGGPPAMLTPMIGTMLGVKTVPITYRNEGKRRSATIDGILDATIEAVPAMAPDAVVVKQNVNPLVSGDWVQAYGVQGTFKDYQFNWDNSGKCADYADFRWSGP